MRTRAAVWMVTLGLSQALLTATARADSAADKTEAARRVLAIAFSPETYQKISDSMGAQLPPDLRPEVLKILPSYQEMADLQLGLFVKYFTTSELNEMARFYASPTGKKAIKVMPEISADAQGYVMTRLQSEMPKILAKLKQQHPDDAAAPSKSP